MNDHIINTWNRVVSPGDSVYVLGDFAMGKIKDTLPLASLLNGNKFLIPGNHDRCWFGGKKDWKSWESKYEDAGFFILANGVDKGCGVVNLNNLFPGNDVDACHFPFTGDSQGEDRYSAHRPVDRGQFLIHGHVHDMWQTNGRMINVGIDVWDYRPVHIDVIQDFFDPF